MNENADVLTSSDAYAQRFAGPVGAFLLDVQTRATLELLKPWPHARVLDLGGGHAQLARPLLDAGYHVTVHGSSPSCSHRLRRSIDADRLRFVAGDLLHAPFPDRAFEVVISYRLLPHMAAWRELVQELCRMARFAVLVDYPSLQSVNVASGSLFGLKRRVEGDTRSFSVFRDADVESAFRDASFKPTGRRRQFLFPMALHRAFGWAGLARALEASGAALGFTGLLGSPVILRAERG
jgi:SAM-dependent methyltransferase